MQDVFITKIRVGKVRHLQGIEILLSDTERKHLILTGKNGSGKTSVLEAMRDSVLFEQQRIKPDGTRLLAVGGLKKKPNIGISYSQNISNFSNFIFAYTSAWRSKLVPPKSIEAFTVQDKTKIAQNASRNFLKYILILDYQRYGAKNNKNTALVAKFDKWFNNFLVALREIYGCSELNLLQDTKNLTFKIEMPGREPFGLHEMADGYTAFLDIFMELLMRFENAEAVVEYEQSAIVMIDEVETHLHIELQKRVLPFLTKMFPNVQFIVSTHSPFVMSSLENAVVYDLEKKEKLDKPSFYSYETIVESFLGTGTYSNELKSYFERYKELCWKQRTSEENEEFLRAKAELEIRSIPSTELYIAFQNLEKQRKVVKNDSSN